MRKISVSKTFDVVTPESAMHGDFAENGFVYRNKKMTVGELIEEIEDLGYFEWSSSTPQAGDWITQLDPEVDLNDASEYRESLHFLDGLKPSEVKILIARIRGMKCAKL